MSKPRTELQKDRQNYRTEGRYAKVHPCYVCGESAGADYCSDSRTDTKGFGDVALVLCDKCATKGEAMTDVNALAFYSSGVKWNK